MYGNRASEEMEEPKQIIRAESGGIRRTRELLRRKREREPLSLVGQWVVVVLGLFGEDDMNVRPFKLGPYIPGPIGRTGHYLGPDGSTPVYVAGGKAFFGEKGRVYTFPTMSQLRRCPDREVDDLIATTAMQIKDENQSDLMRRLANLRA